MMHSYNLNYIPCKGGHRWFWDDSDSYGRVPEGMKCECGVWEAHWEICDKCGSDIFRPIFHGHTEGE